MSLSAKQRSRMAAKARRRFYLSRRDKMHAARNADSWTRLNAVMAYAYREMFARGLFLDHGSLHAWQRRKVG